MRDDAVHSSGRSRLRRLLPGLLLVLALVAAACGGDTDTGAEGENGDADTDGGITTIGDLKGNGDMFDGRIIGIEPGAGLMRITREEAMPTYELEDEYTLVEGSTSAMLAELERATAAEEPIVVTLWHPHWAYSAFPIKDLEDPEGAMGDAEELHAIGREGFSDDFPTLAEWFGNFEISDEDLASLEELVINEYDDGQEEEAVDEWLEDSENQALVDEWIGDGEAEGGEVHIGWIPWDEDIAVTFLWKSILEDAGYTVELTSTDVAPVYAGLAEGDMDLFLDAWLPTTHEDYWEEFGDQLEDLGVWYDQGTLNIAIPTYVD